jgi:excisionase family DNA binding protein
MDKLYTCEEVAERYQVQLTTVWDWIRSKFLPAIKLGRVYRIRECDLKDFEQANLTGNRSKE